MGRARAMLAVLATALLACASAPRPLWEHALVDLTHTFDEKTIYWPTETGFEMTTRAQGRTEAGYWYEAHAVSTPEHGGTHMDAPVHFFEGGDAADEIPLERLVGPGVVVDVRDAVAADRDHLVGVADLEVWEAAHGPLREGAIVLLRTGIGRFWPDRARYLGTARRGEAALAELHFPGLDADADAVPWLAERGVSAVGIDTASIDHGPSRRFRAHVALFERGIPAFENVANLERLPPRGFTVIALPMKIGGGSGGPLRIVAALP